MRGAAAFVSELTALVLDRATSEHSKRAYGKGLAQFFAWGKERPPRPFSKALVQEYRVWLLEQDLATGVRKTKGLKQKGVQGRELAAARTMGIEEVCR